MPATRFLSGMVKFVVWVSFFKLQHSVNCHNHPQPLLLVQYSHDVVSYGWVDGFITITDKVVNFVKFVQRQKSNVVALHSTAAAVRQHMTQRHDHIAHAVMVVDSCDNLLNVAI